MLGAFSQKSMQVPSSAPPLSAENPKQLGPEGTAKNPLLFVRCGQN